MAQENNLLAVNEIFGPTFQGEGKNTGMPCMFLRLAGCNLACSWCDTRYAWDWQQYDPKREIHKMTPEDILARLAYSVSLDGSRIKSVVISGGEPMLQHKALYNVTKVLHTWGWHTEIETAGTIAPKSTELCKLYTVSPKLKNSGNPHDKRYKPDVLRLLNESGRAVFKFVVSDWQDFDEIDDMVEDLDLKQVYIMPEGTDPAKITYGLEALAAHCIERGYHISTRLQVMIYGNKRGV